MPEPLLALHVLLAQAHGPGGPSCFVLITPPEHSGGAWWLDFLAKPGRAIVTLQGSRFGISAWRPFAEDKDPGYGENPDKVVASPEEAAGAVEEMLAANVRGRGCDPGLE